jgi:hypothetical protein
MNIKHPLRISARPILIFRVGSDSEIYLVPCDIGEYGRTVWYWSVESKGETLGEGRDISTCIEKPNSATRTLLSELRTASEIYRFEMDEVKSKGGRIFNKDIKEWAYQNEDEISMLLKELRYK